MPDDPKNPKVVPSQNILYSSDAFDMSDIPKTYPGSTFSSPIFASSSFVELSGAGSSLLYDQAKVRSLGTRSGVCGTASAR